MTYPTLARSLLLVLTLGAALVAGQAPAGSEDLASLKRALSASELKGLERWEVFRPRFEALAARAPASAEALEALLIMLEETRFERRRGTMHASAGALLAKILEHHGDFRASSSWRVCSASWHPTCDAPPSLRSARTHLTPRSRPQCSSRWVAAISSAAIPSCAVGERSC